MNKNFKNSANSIQNEINSIFNSLKANLEEGLVVEKDHRFKSSSFCKGKINVFDQKDFLKMKEDRNYRVTPIESYTFYEDTIKPARIGSVAIYGDNAYNRCLLIKKRGYLFGRRIISARVEMGRRPFVDVKLVV